MNSEIMFMSSVQFMLSRNSAIIQVKLVYVFFNKKHAQKHEAK